MQICDFSGHVHSTIQVRAVVDDAEITLESLSGAAGGSEQRNEKDGQGSRRGNDNYELYTAATVWKI
jgi:hypothetical protein